MDYKHVLNQEVCTSFVVPKGCRTTDLLSEGLVSSPSYLTETISINRPPWALPVVQTGESVMKVSAYSIAELQCQIPEPPHYIKCLAVHPEPGRHGDVRVAVGQANGRVSLLSFVPQMSGHAIKEFGPKQVTLTYSGLSIVIVVEKKFKQYSVDNESY